MDESHRRQEEAPEHFESENEGGMTPNRTAPGGPGVTSGNAATSASDPAGYGGAAAPQPPVDPTGDNPERAG